MTSLIGYSIVEEQSEKASIDYRLYQKLASEECGKPLLREPTTYRVVLNLSTLLILTCTSFLLRLSTLQVKISINKPDK